MSSSGTAPRMVAAISVLGLALAAPTVARGDAIGDHLARVRALYDQGDFLHARDELLAAYRLEPRPELLFALGQVELNLGRFAQAIAYYERFIATQPAADQVALAQQAIGAARAGLAEKSPTPQPAEPRPAPSEPAPAEPSPGPPPESQPAQPAEPAPPQTAQPRTTRPQPQPQPSLQPAPRWDVVATDLAVAGGALVVTGAGLVIYGVHAGNDQSGRLSAYNSRMSRAVIAEWVGGASLAVGALAVGGAVLRWRLHTGDAEVQPIVAPRTAGVAWIQRW